MTVSGVNIDITVGSGSWADSKDPIYLGVYGKNGGREFPLQVNGDSPINTIGATINLVLGTSCCNKEGVNYLQIDNSQNLSHNDPLLNPIELEDIEYVYLRKYGGQYASSDDFGELSEVSVLFCDNLGNVIRYRKEGRIHFAKEAGLQHWLVETDPPRCRVLITLDEISHEDGPSTPPAGNNWILTWNALVGGNSNSDSVQYLWMPDDEWTRRPGRTLEFEIVGCNCGTIPIQLNCQSLMPTPFPPFFGFDTASLQIACTDQGNTLNQILTTVVPGVPGLSILTYTFTIEATCID